MSAPPFREFKLAKNTDRSEEKISITASVTIAVKQAGNVAPGETTFNLQVIGSNGDKLSSGDVEIEAKPITTNGEGNYDGTVTIKGTYEDIRLMLSDKVFVKQAGVDDPDWTVDDKVWGLMMTEAAAMAVSDNSDGAAECSLLILPAEYYETDNGGYYEMVDGADAVDNMTFTNTYTKSAADSSESEDTTNGDTDNESEIAAEDSAKTGDNTNLSLLIALMLLSAAGITGTAVYTRRKRVE